jgi:hypothetical protein
MADETPFAIDNLLFDTAICLAKIKDIVVGNHKFDTIFPETPRFGLQQIIRDRGINNYKDFFTYFAINNKGYFLERNSKY